MFSGRKSAQKRREQIETADRASSAALAALAAGDAKKAKGELSAAPRVHFAEIGWKVELASALIELGLGRRRQGTAKLVDVCRRLDDTSLGKDDKNYLRLYALYRASEYTKDGKAPSELRDLVEDFRFDHTRLDARIRTEFPLKKVDETAAVPPPPPPPPPGEDIDL